MVEFALLTPLFVLFMVGILDFSIGFYQYTQLVNGTREGARVGAFGVDTTAIKNAVKNTTTIGLTDADITITCYAGATITTIDCLSPPLVSGDGVKVTATKLFQPFTPKLASIIGPSLNLTAYSLRSLQ